jgi:hypothetical protein
MTGAGDQAGAGSSPADESGSAASDAWARPDPAAVPSPPSYGPPSPYAPVTPGQPHQAIGASPSAPGNHRAVIATVIVGVVLLVACFGVAGSLILLRSQNTVGSGSQGGAPASPTARNGPSASTTAQPEQEPAGQGPRASAYAAEEINDLSRVCDENVYYPQSPKRAGKAPHPVVLLVSDVEGSRYQDGTYYFSEGVSDKAEQAWASEDPRKVQMVACLDRVSAGGKIRSCKYDDPEPSTASLVRASWRLRVYEAATGRKLLDKAMAGDDQKCPYVVLIRADGKIYAKVSDRVVVAALRSLVNR